MADTNERITRGQNAFLKKARLAALTGILLFFAAAGGAQAASRALILYDGAGNYGWRGDLSSLLLTNLLSHMNVEYVREDVDSYASGDMNGYDQVFYLGTDYRSSLPDAFLQDVLTTSATVCWMGYNLHLIAWGTYKTQFEAAFGIAFDRLDSTTSWSEVLYNGVSLPISYGELGVTHATMAAGAPEAVTLALAKGLAGEVAKEAPYIIRGGDFYYVADNPFDRNVDADRSLAFDDVLYDITGAYPELIHKAVLRIEDVHPKVDPQYLRNLADYLYSAGVPFMISVIPRYMDPLHYYNAPYDVTWQDVPETLDALRYMVRKGGRVIMHGYTHQYDSVKNPDSGVTADDWEFFRVTRKADGSAKYVGPVDEDSVEWATQRMDAGLDILNKARLKTVAWLTPHYLASPTDYPVFARYFSTALDRGVYFVTGADGNLRFKEQYIPYVVDRDVYGLTRIPETVGYVSPGSVPPLTPADVLAKASRCLAVRDGWAGAYYHWFLDVDGLREVVTGLKNLGFVFTYVGKPVGDPGAAINTLLLSQ